MNNVLFTMLALPSINLIGSLTSIVYKLPLFILIYPLRFIASPLPSSSNWILIFPFAESRSAKYGERNGNEYNSAFASKLIVSSLKKDPNLEELRFKSKGT